MDGVCEVHTYVHMYKSSVLEIRVPIKIENKLRISNTWLANIEVMSFWCFGPKKQARKEPSQTHDS